MDFIGGLNTVSVVSVQFKIESLRIRSLRIIREEKKVPRSDLVQNRRDFVENPSIKCGFLVESISRFLRFCQVYKDWTLFINCHSFEYHFNKFNFSCYERETFYAKK